MIRLFESEKLNLILFFCCSRNDIKCFNELLKIMIMDDDEESSASVDTHTAVPSRRVRSNPPTGGSTSQSTSRRAFSSQRRRHSTPPSRSLPMASQQQQSQATSTTTPAQLDLLNRKLFSDQIKCKCDFWFSSRYIFFNFSSVGSSIGLIIGKNQTKYWTRWDLIWFIIANIKR